LRKSGNQYRHRVNEWKTALHWGWDTISEYERMVKVVKDAVFDRFEYQHKVIELLLSRTSEPLIRIQEGFEGRKLYYLDYHPMPPLHRYKGCEYRSWERKLLQSDLVENPEKISNLDEFLTYDAVSQADKLLKAST